MSKFSEYIGSQFGNPRGFVGKCCCIIMNIINNAMYKSVVENICINEKSNVLDIGYGNGNLIHKIYKKYKSTIFGIDISEDMKNSATNRNQSAIDCGKVFLSVGDCCELNFDNNFFDAVTSINTIYFWNNTLIGLKEIHRVLKSGGTFYNVVYSKEWLKRLSYTKKGFKFFETDDYISLGYEAGFSEVLVKNIANGKSYIICFKK